MEKKEIHLCYITQIWIWILDSVNAHGALLYRIGMTVQVYKLTATTADCATSISPTPFLAPLTSPYRCDSCPRKSPSWNIVSQTLTGGRNTP